jgi:uncharacterized protein YqeY
MFMNELRAKYLAARKAKSTLVPFIAFLISEIEKIGKNSGNRETSNDEAISVVKKMVATLKGSAQNNAEVISQISFMEELLPAMVSRETVEKFIFDNFLDINKPAVMKAVKASYGATVDMKMVGEILKEKYGI